MRRPSFIGRPGVVLWALTPAAAAMSWLAASRTVLPEGAGQTICLLRRFAGLPCPGCGLTRAFVHLAHGEWAAALVDHPLAPLIAVQLVVGWVAIGLALAGRLPPRPRRWVSPWLVANAVGLCALWLGRLATGTLPW